MNHETNEITVAHIFATKIRSIFIPLFSRSLEKFDLQSTQSTVTTNNKKKIQSCYRLNTIMNEISQTSTACDRCYKMVRRNKTIHTHTYTHKLNTDLFRKWQKRIEQSIKHIVSTNRNNLNKTRLMRHNVFASTNNWSTLMNQRFDLQFFFSFLNRRFF